MNKLSRVIVLYVCCSVIAAIICSTAWASHTPRFTWQIRGGVVNPEQWIYDGDTPIAMFEQRTIEQPGEQLLFFNLVPKPIVLRYVKLTPDGAPLIDGIQLYCKCGTIITSKLIGLDIQGQGTDRFVAAFTTCDPWGVVTLKRVLTLTYDQSRETYIYDFNDELTFQSPELFNGKEQTFEFCDPWFTGCPGPSIPFTGMWKKRYQHCVYESPDGAVKKIPLNHFTTSHKSGIALKSDGMFITAFEPDGNPAIQFVGETAERSNINICWWGYDFHLVRRVTADELFSPIPFHFRIFKCPVGTVQDLTKKAVVPPLKPDEWGGKDEYPVYERSCSFQKGLRLDGSFPGDIDPYPWQIEGQGAEWDKTSGRNDNASLKIAKNTQGLTRWSTYLGEGEGYFMEKWTPCKGYKVSCWVKTQSVTGRGATVAIHYYVVHPPQAFPVKTARKLTGTNDWTRLEVEIGSPSEPPPVIGSLMIMLQQDGSGTTWFDDLEVTPVK